MFLLIKILAINFLLTFIIPIARIISNIPFIISTYIFKNRVENTQNDLIFASSVLNIKLAIEIYFSILTSSTMILIIKSYNLNTFKTITLTILSLLLILRTNRILYKQDLKRVSLDHSKINYGGKLIAILISFICFSFINYENVLLFNWLFNYINRLLL
jgi:hypothetical protein